MFTEIFAFSFCVGAIAYQSAFLEFKKDDTKIIDDVFENLNISIKTLSGTLRPRYVKSEPQEWGIRHFYELPKGISSEQVKNLSETISEALKRDVDISHDFYLQIDVYEKRLSEKVPLDENLIDLKDYKIPIGVNKKLKVEYFNLVGDFSHLLIGGLSGAGKSKLVHLILTSLSIKDYPPNFYLCDLKFGVELSEFENLKHTKGFVTELEDLDMMLDLVIEEMKSRYKEMRQRSIKMWDKEPTVVLIDEMIDLKIVGSDAKEIKALKGRITRKLMDISAKGRASKTYTILATQRPDAEVISGIIKGNIATTIGFKTRDSIQSRIILDNPLSSELDYIPGRAYFQQSEDTLIQTFYLSEEKESELLAKVEKVIHHESSDDENRKMEQDSVYPRQVEFFNNKSNSNVIQLRR